MRHMEYFKKLQCYKPKKAIIDSPISIEEVALLQDTIDKNILGRIKFINRSQQSIIAIFVHLSASNIAGENVPAEKERYIYQDMKINPGELYGNKIPLHLPDDTRKLAVKLEKVVFENGEIWDAATGIECEHIPQEEIDIPIYVIEKMQKELSPHFSHMEYIRYFYEKGQNFWECTCGRINSVSDDKCSFCGNDRQSQEEYLVQDKLIPLIAKKKQEVEQEKIRQEEEKKRLKKEAEKREYERIQKEWAKREAEERELAKQAKKRKRTWICIGIIVVVVICVIMIASYYHQEKVNKEIYSNAQELLESGEYDKAIEEWNRIFSYEDSETQIKEATYKKAMNLFENKKYDEAIEMWQGISDYKDSSEQIDNAYLAQKLNGIKKKYKNALKIFPEKNRKSEDAKYIAKILSYVGEDEEFMRQYGKFDFDSMERSVSDSVISYSEKGKFNGYDVTYNILFKKENGYCYGVNFDFDMVAMNYSPYTSINVISDFMGRTYDKEEDDKSIYMSEYYWNTDIIDTCSLMIFDSYGISAGMRFFD